MTFRSKFRFWLPILVIAMVVVFVAPAVSKTSFIDLIGQWFDEYNEAVNAVEAEDVEHDDATADSNGTSLLVRIDDEIQQYSGIKTQLLNQTEFYPETKATARVIDITPMLSLRSNYLNVQSEKKVLAVAEHAAAQEMARLKTLATATKSVASKNLVYAESSWREAKAKLDGVDYQLQALREQARHQWGQEIASWLLTKESSQWQRLLTRSDSLLLVTLPVEQRLPEYVKQVRLSHTSLQDSSISAVLISEAAQTDSLIQGETYFFKVADMSLRIGMRVDVWFHQQQQPLSGVFVPEQAIVWSSGQAWVYIELEEGLYQRRSLQSAVAADKGMFVIDSDALKASDKLVINGAQMLLSEEFRWQILDEDDD